LAADLFKFKSENSKVKKVCGRFHAAQTAGRPTRRFNSTKIQQ